MSIDIDTMRGMLGMWESMVDRLGADAAADVLVALNPDPDVIEEIAGRAEQLAEEAGNEFRPTKVGRKWVHAEVRRLDLTRTIKISPDNMLPVE